MAIINLGTLFNRLQNLVNKDDWGRVYTINQLNNDLPFIYSKFLKKRYGLPEDANPVMAYEIIQKITDDLLMLKKWMGDESTPLLVINSKGKATLPSDYWHPASLYYTLMENNCNGETAERIVRIPFVTEDHRVSLLSSSLMKPTRKNPIATFYNGFIQIEPKDIGAANFVYLINPPSPFYDYDIINDEEVFLPAGEVHINNSVMPQGSPSRTVEFLLPDDCYEDIVDILLADYGLRIHNQLDLQVGEQRKNTGF